MLARARAALNDGVEPEHGLRFSEGNRVTLFHHGRPALQAMLDAIDGARDRIHLETYILRSDRTGRRVLAALLGRVHRGVSVRLLYDGFGSLGLDASALVPLKRAGADVVAFNPLGRLWPHWAPRRRDHRKILCVDGRIGFAGGLNVGDEYWGSEPEGASDAGWRDTHLRIEGPAVRDLDAVFLESWFRADGPFVAWHDVLSQPSGGAEMLGSVRCAVMPDGPSYRRRRMRELVVAALHGTQAEAKLASPYFAPGRRVLSSLGQAAKRGVSVELMLAGRTDHPVLRRAARAFLPRLLPQGVRVLEYERVVMHAKLAIFDRRLAIVGSSNLDRQSLEHSYEVNLVLEGGDISEQLADRFERDTQDCTLLDASAIARRSLRDRVLDRMSAWLLRIV